jgi:hypothetical protein
MLAVDFFTVETIWSQRLYVLFFIELGSRRVHVAGCTPTPSALWVTQQARQLTWTLAERPASFRFLIRDRDQKFTDSFDDVFRNCAERIQTAGGAIKQYVVFRAVPCRTYSWRSSTSRIAWSTSAINAGDSRARGPSINRRLSMARN